MRARTILFVDDEEKCCKYFKRLFRPDFEVLVATGGDEALELFAERGSEIGLVVTDQIMPGIAGLDVLKKIRETDAKVVRILSTAYADSDSVAESAREGLIDYVLIKPWDIDRVHSVLSQAVAHFEQAIAKG